MIGVGVFFLVTFERRLKRRRILKAIHELRSAAHIVDMLTTGLSGKIWQKLMILETTGGE